MGLPVEDDDRTCRSSALSGRGDESCGERTESGTDSGERTERRLRSRSGTVALGRNKSVWAVIEANENFMNTTLFIIVLNALWIGADTEWNHKTLVKDDGSYPLEPTSAVVENLFCVYFTVEVLIRFLAFRRTVDCFRDAWFVFDSLLVTCMVVETWLLAIIELISGGSGGASFLSNFSALRLLRLLRLTRMARLMRSFPELRTLVKGMVAAGMAVIWIILLLTIVIYIFAIVFASSVGDANKEPEEESCQWYFGTIGDAMMSLFTRGVLGDELSNTVNAILAHDDPVVALFLFWVFMLFFAISSMTLLNMLLGVLCEVITATAKSELDTSAVNNLGICIEDAFDELDLNDDGRVCEGEWCTIKNNVNVREQLGALGVEAEHMEDRLDQMKQVIFGRGEYSTEGLPLDKLIAKVIEVRPDKPVTILDLEILKTQVQISDKDFQAKLGSVENLMCKMLAKKGGGAKAVDQVSAMPPEAPPEGHSRLGEVPTELLLTEINNRTKAFSTEDPNSRGNARGLPGSVMEPMQFESPDKISCPRKNSTDASSANDFAGIVPCES